MRRSKVRDGRFRVELELQRGLNEVRLEASAPGRAETEPVDCRAVAVAGDMGRCSTFPVCRAVAALMTSTEGR